MALTRLHAFKQQIKPFLPESALIEDYSRRYAYGTDASFYRLIPELIVLVSNQNQARQSDHCCQRATGTHHISRRWNEFIWASNYRFGIGFVV